MRLMVERQEEAKEMPTKGMGEAIASTVIPAVIATRCTNEPPC